MAEMNAHERPVSPASDVVPLASHASKGAKLGDLIGAHVEFLRRHPGTWKAIRRYSSHTGALMAAKSARKIFPDVTFESHPSAPDDTGRRGSELWAHVPKKDQPLREDVSP